MNEKTNNFSVADKAARECLSLPIFPELIGTQIQRVVDVRDIDAGKGVPISDVRKRVASWAAK